MADVVTIGESMILIQSMTDQPLQYAPVFTKTIAGAESNVAIGLTRLGKKARWISRVGDDPFGKYLLATLTGEGIDTSYCVIGQNESTAIYFKDFKGSGDPIVYYYRKDSAASKLHPDHILSNWFDDARHLHITGITPALGKHTAEAMMVAMEKAQDQGLTISFDPNIRKKLWSEEEAKKTIGEMIPLCDIFMPGLDECQFLFGDKTLEQYGEMLLQMGPKLVIIKLGDKGSIAMTEKYTVQKKGFVVERIIDTVGAGDAFAAGSLSILLDVPQLKTALANKSLTKEQIGQALERGNRLGSLTVAFKGDWEGLPTIEELRDIEEGENPISR